MRIIRLIIIPLAFAACTIAPPPETAPRVERSEILWDTWGVPHVYGRTVQDVGYGFGWAQAHAHGDAILRLYGLARGRAAEYWGEQYTASDRLMRTMGIPAAGVDGYEEQEPAFRESTRQERAIRRVRHSDQHEPERADSRERGVRDVERSRQPAGELGEPWREQVDADHPGHRHAGEAERGEEKELARGGAEVARVRQWPAVPLIPFVTESAVGLDLHEEPRLAC